MMTHRDGNAHKFNIRDHIQDNCEENMQLGNSWLAAILGAQVC